MKVEEEKGGKKEGGNGKGNVRVMVGRRRDRREERTSRRK